jgi:hypothetical protein
LIQGPSSSPGLWRGLLSVRKCSTEPQRRHSSWGTWPATCENCEESHDFGAHSLQGVSRDKTPNSIGLGAQCRSRHGTHRVARPCVRTTPCATSCMLADQPIPGDASRTHLIRATCNNYASYLRPSCSRIIAISADTEKPARSDLMVPNPYPGSRTQWRLSSPSGYALF